MMASILPPPRTEEQTHSAALVGPACRAEPGQAVLLGKQDLPLARVAVLGCGSVGGFAAWACVAAGVGTLELADRDRLEEDNLRRHVCGCGDLGRFKAEAVVDFLVQRFPAAVVRAHPFDFLEEPDRLRALLAVVDVALVAVDDEAPKHLIDAMTRELGRPVVYAGVYGDGWGVEVIRTDPVAGSPCYGCAARSLGRAGIRLDPALAGSAYARPVSHVAPEAWPRADLGSILPCALLAARVAMASLGRPHGFWDKGSWAWRLALQPVRAWQAEPWTLQPVPVVRQPDCPTCGACRRDAVDLAPLLDRRYDDAGRHA